MKQILIGAALILLSACTSVHHTKKEVIRQDQDIAELSNQVEEAKVHQVNLLAPGHFQAAVMKLNEAIERATKSKDMAAGNAIAKDGLALLAKANEVAKNSKATLSLALTKRSQAEDAQADRLFEKEFADLDGKLQAAGRMFEEGQLNRVQEANRSLAQAYNDLLVKSLKVGVTKDADQAIRAAQQAQADRNAPKTFQSAKNELDIAKKIIEVEKGDVKKAQFHAERATYLANKAKAISDILIQHKTENLTGEERILWYQDQLTKSFQPLNEVPPFDLPNPMVVSTMAQRVQDVLNALQSAERRNKDAERKIGSLNNKIEGLVNEKEKIVLRAERERELEQSIQKMFSPNEAEVLRSGDATLIRSYGFSFPSGSADLKAANFGLLHKLVSAITKFPDANIQVLGFTDSTGSSERNQQLSQQRAQNIAEYLIKVAGIDPKRVTAKGMGDAHPIAPNNTAEGRAKNRRIEVLIQPAG